MPPSENAVGTAVILDFFTVPTRLYSGPVLILVLGTVEPT